MQDVSTRSNSAYYMLGRLLYLKETVGVVLGSDDKASHLSFSKQEWNLIKNLVGISQLIEVVATQLSGGSCSTILLVLTPVHGLHKQLAVRAEYYVSVAHLGEDLEAQLAQQLHLDKPALDDISAAYLCWILTFASFPF